MEFSQIKLIATDMDGTLLDPEHRLSPEFFPILKALREKGILFAAASGRQYYNLVQVLESVQDQVIFVAENGSFVMYQGKELLLQAMEPKTVKAQLEKAKGVPDTHIVLCGKKTAYVDSDHPQFLDQVGLYYSKVQVVEDVRQVTDDDILKIAIFDLAGAESNSNTYFQEEKEYLQVTVSGKSWLDICHKLANKGRALEVLQEKFDVTPQETMVFGDYLNDLKMIQKAHHSYAMENAHDSIKEAARYTAKSNQQNGVVEVLQKLLRAL